MKKSKLIIISICAVLAVVAIGIVLNISAANSKRYSLVTFVMDTNVEQKAYGKNATKVMKLVQDEFVRMEEMLSMHKENSEISKINSLSGKTAVKVNEETYAFLQKSKELALQSNNTFALTIAPLTSAWGITTDNPKVLSQEEIGVLLNLVNDNDIILDSGTVRLAREGQAIDLGGIAKGEACDRAATIYRDNGVKTALLSMGSSSILAFGEKPDGSGYRIGFRNPKADENAFICSFILKDEFMSTSGGYERFFEQESIRYHHIIDPKTGKPAQSDIVSVGVITDNGAKADVLSTELFVKGLSGAIDYLNNGGNAIVLDEDNRLHISSEIMKTLEFADGLESEYEVIVYE